MTANPKNATQWHPIVDTKSNTISKNLARYHRHSQTIFRWCRTYFPKRHQFHAKLFHSILLCLTKIATDQKSNAVYALCQYNKSREQKTDTDLQHVQTEFCVNWGIYTCNYRLTICCNSVNNVIFIMLANYTTPEVKTVSISHC